MEHLLMIHLVVIDSIGLAVNHRGGDMNNEGYSDIIIAGIHLIISILLLLNTSFYLW